MRREGNPWLVAGGLLSAAAALLHLAVIAGGPDWYRFFGAGEEMARMAERGSPRPVLITLAIAAILGLWSAYAFAGAGLLRRLPLMRTALIVITAIYLLRGLVLVPVLAINRLSADNIGVASERSGTGSMCASPSAWAGNRISTGFTEGSVEAFTMWSSLIVLVYGITYAVGTFRAWPALSAEAA